MNSNCEKITGLALTERLLIVGGLVVASILSWAYTIQMVRDMGASTTVSRSCAHHMPGHPTVDSVVMPHLTSWGASEAWMTFVMWSVMMAGMMLPTAIPMVLSFARVNRQHGRSGLLVPVGSFTVGYLGAWALFCVGATTLQWWLLRMALISPVSLASGPVLGGCLLIMAGIYQWTPWKDACMEKCRNPLGFLLTHWKPGRLGALKLGIRFGLYCVGCCWFLMLICFGLGVMNLTWMAVLTIFMLLEKVTSAERLIPQSAGLIMILWGGWVLIA